MIIKRCLYPLLVLIFLALSYTAQAQQVPVTAPSGSSSTSNGGVNASGSWTGNNGGFNITWGVTKQGSTYHYVYSISNAAGGSLSSGLSYLMVQVDPSVTSSNLSTMITSITPGISIVLGPQTFDQNYTGVSGNVYGIVFGNTNNNNNTATFSSLSFTSTLAPVWGSYYGINNNWNSTAYNTGYANNPSTGTSNFSGWLPTPGLAVPEPSTWIILSSFILFVILWKSKKQAKKTT
jgi:hypothetical protein